MSPAVYKAYLVVFSAGGRATEAGIYSEQSPTIHSMGVDASTALAVATSRTSYGKACGYLQPLLRKLKDEGLRVHPSFLRSAR